jgi:segregation and condensation protein B
MSEDRFQLLRLLEAVLFASTEPLTEKALAARLPDDADLAGLLSELKEHYANRGVNLARIADRWAFRTASDLATRLQIERKVNRKLSRAAIESLAIIAYHQPVTRAEIEEIRGVVISKGTLDLLLEIGWIVPKGRRETPGRPVTWGTTDAFLEHFGLEGTEALPGVEELRAAGLLDSRAAISTLATQASSGSHLQPDEDAEAEEAGAELRGDAPLAETADLESVQHEATASEATASEDSEPAEDGDSAPADDDYESELLRHHGLPEEDSTDRGAADETSDGENAEPEWDESGNTESRPVESQGMESEQAESEEAESLDAGLETGESKAAASDQPARE